MKQTCWRTAAISSIAEKLESATMMMRRFGSQRAGECLGGPSLSAPYTSSRRNNGSEENQFGNSFTPSRGRSKRADW